eukprot:2318454-Pleurochrysis_carterae.AAC.1
MAVFSIVTISKSLAGKALLLPPIKPQTCHSSPLAAISPPRARHARRTALARVNTCILSEPLGR